MLSAENIHRIYKNNGVDLHDQTWADDPNKWLDLAAKKSAPHFWAAKQVLGETNPELKEYWDRIFWPLAKAFRGQIKKPESKYKNWGVELSVLGKYPETLALAMLASAPSKEQALMALKENNEIAAGRYAKGDVVVLAMDGEVINPCQVEVEVNIARPDKNYPRDFMTFQIVRWLNGHYHQSRDPQHMTMTWLAGVGWSQLSESAQNLGEEKTVVFTNLLKNFPEARRYCDKFGWKYPGDAQIREAMLAIYVAHEHMHGTRGMDKFLDELSSDIPALACTLDLARKGLLGTVGAKDVVLAALAEYGALGKYRTTGNVFVDSYGLSGRCILNSMFNTGLIVPQGRDLKLNMYYLDSFWQQLMWCERVLAQGGPEREIIQSLPTGELPEQLLEIL